MITRISSRFHSKTKIIIESHQKQCENEILCKHLQTKVTMDVVVAVEFFVKS